MEGVTAGSAGNHAQAIAFAAQHFGLGCEIFVPAGAPIGKIEACRSSARPSPKAARALMEAVAGAEARAIATGWAFCHPFDDPVVVAGQGTLGLELLDDIDDLRAGRRPARRRWAGGRDGDRGQVELAVRFGSSASRPPRARRTAGHAAPVVRSSTLADGIAVKSPGAITRPLVERWIDEIVTVDEESIADAMVLLMERAKLYVEGAGAVGVAALLAGARRRQPRRHDVRRAVGRQRRPRRRARA